MKRLISFAVLFLCAAPLPGAVTCNGTFESRDRQGIPTLWRLSGDARVEQGVGCGGSAGIVLRGAKKPARATQDAEVVPGKLYMLSADVKTTGGEACVFAEWFDAGGKWKGGFYVKNVKDTGGEWKHVEVLSKPMSPGVQRLRVQAQHKGEGKNAAIVDNIVLEEYVLPSAPDANRVPYRYRGGVESCARVRIDGKNRAIVDGKPFFPLGLYGGIAPEDIGRVADSPFNTLMVYSAPNVSALDLARKHGLKVIAGINHVWADNPLRPALVKTPEDADRWLAGYVSRVKGHDALLAWYLYDEPPVTEVPRLARRRTFMEKADPDHPCWGSLNVPQLTAWYLDAFDVAGADPYPISREPLSMVSEWVSFAREGTKGGRALWMIPQIFDYRNYGRKDSHVPTRAEIRNMTWQCIVGGATGIIYFKYKDLEKNPSGDATFESRWADVCAVAQEVKDFMPMLLSDDDAPVVEVSNGDIRARAFRRGGETWLVAVNLSSKSAATTLVADGISEKMELGPFGVKVFRVGCRPEYVAHQGEELLAPSHTAAAYRLAVEHGLDYMKLDVHETRDGVIVTQHDADLKRTYGVDLAIRKADYAEIAKLSALPVGGYSNETICTLAQALEIAKPMKGIWIDFKQFSPDFMDRVFDVVDKAGVPVEKVMVATFNHWALKWTPRKRPGIRLVAHTQIVKAEGGYKLNYGEKGLVYADEDAVADAIVAYAKKMKLYGVNMPAPHRWRKDRYATTPKMVHRLHDAGLWVSIWFVNDPDTGEFYRNCGADAFVTGCAAQTMPCWGILTKQTAFDIISRNRQERGT